MSEKSASDVIEIERLAKAADAATVEIEGNKYSTTPLFRPSMQETVPEPVVLSTLESLVDYLTEEIDVAYRRDRGTVVHVASPTHVRILTTVFGKENQRATMVVAKATVPNLGLGSWEDPESFLIRLQTAFEDNEGRRQVLALAGNIQTEAVQTVADDGVSQTATAKRGIAQRQTVAVPNPITLKPRRSFPEVAQTESAFILRLRGGSVSPPTLPMCALFEADGGAWQVDATAKIRAFLKTELDALKITVLG